jgi:hypothetical protein
LQLEIIDSDITTEGSILSPIPSIFLKIAFFSPLQIELNHFPIQTEYQVSFVSLGQKVNMTNFWHSPIPYYIFKAPSLPFSHL